MPEMRFKRKKVNKYRGSHTHGGGSKKKRRGAGHRGGRGNAGSGKKGDVKKDRFINAGRRFGRYGFVNPTRTTHSTINVGILQQQITRQLESGAVPKAEHYVIDLTKMGVDKLLGHGKVVDKFHVTVKHISESAKQKIEEAGGKVNANVDK